MTAGRYPYNHGGIREITPAYHPGSTPVHGSVFFVDSNHDQAGTSTNEGQKRQPCSTIASALAQCTANNGDLIILAPGHAETISAAGGIAIDKAGVHILGMGRGTAMPTITFDTAITADLDIDAANVTIENVHFRANFADITAAIDVNATDFALIGCRFSEVATDMNAKIWIQDGATTTSNYMTIQGCYANLTDAANTHFVNFAGTGTGHIVKDNILNGDWGTMAIGGAGVITDAMILNNNIHNVATDADACISVAATATGLIAQNNATGGHATDGIECGNMGSIENYYVLSTAALSGVIEPAIA